MFWRAKNAAIDFRFGIRAGLLLDQSLTQRFLTVRLAGSPLNRASASTNTMNQMPVSVR